VDKATLRKLFLEKRQNLSRSKYGSLTDGMIDQVKSFNWSDYRVVHVFLPIRNKNEVDTFSILNFFKENCPDLKIVIPRTDFKNLLMENVQYDHKSTTLGLNKFDIPEPIHGKIISAEEIDFVFVPLLAFDKKGNRVGYGKGFYDRFLTNCRPDVKKVGLSYFDPVEEIYDLNKFDIKIDACICPDKIWQF
jgi:5-formyltetrahydrofolate cyclo-ligase